MINLASLHAAAAQSSYFGGIYLNEQLIDATILLDDLFESDLTALMIACLRNNFTAV